MEENNIQLTINDIALTRDVIDLACKRGAFNGAESRQVGTLYEKIDLFIKTALAQAEAEKQAETGDPELANTPEPQGE